MTFRDLILRTAIAVGLAHYPSAGAAAAIPDSAHDLDKVKRAVRDGVDMFVSGSVAPPGVKVRWSFTRPLVSLTLSTDGTAPESIGADASRYRLPWYVEGSPSGPWIVTASSVQGGGKIDNTEIGRVVALLSTSPSTGRPVLAATIPFAAGAMQGDRRGWEVRFWPKPDRAYVVSAQFRAQHRALEALDERHICGALHDQAILAHAIYALKKHDVDDAALRADYREDAVRALLASLQADQDQGPRSLGVVRDPTAEMAPPGRTDFSQTRTYNGVA